MRALLIFSLFIFHSFSHAHKLTIELTGIQPGPGKMNIALFDKADGFPMEWKKSKIHRWEEVNADKLSVVIEVPGNGPWAIAVFHDRDGNQEINTNWIGMPKEGVGVSKNAKGFMGPPKFKKAQFEITGDQSVSIKMKYL